MAVTTILTVDDFTDSDLLGSLGPETNKHTVKGENKYLLRGDDYYGQLLRERSIDPTDTTLADPQTVFEIVNVLMNWVAVQVCRDGINGQQDMYENMTPLQDEFKIKMKEYMLALKIALSDLDDNVFFTDLPKGEESSITGEFSRM
jgi:hypothetical protein